MKKFRSLTALIIVMMLVLSLAGCGSKEKDLSAAEILKKSSEALTSTDFEMSLDFGVKEQWKTQTVGAVLKGTVDKNGNMYMSADVAADGEKLTLSLYFIASEMTVYADVAGTTVKADLQKLYDTYAPLLSQLGDIDSSVMSQLDPKTIKEAISKSGKAYKQIEEYFNLGKPVNSGSDKVIELTLNEKTVKAFTERFREELEKELNGNEAAKVEKLINRMAEIMAENPVVFTVNGRNEPVSVKWDLTDAINDFTEALEDISGQDVDMKCTKAVFEIKYSNVGKASEVKVPDKVKSGAIDLVMMLPFLLQ